jgi:hypothetical protein
MTLPTVRGVGTVSSGTGNITPGLPASTAVNDILVLPIETANEVVPLPTGWSQLNGLVVIVASGVATRLTILWRRATGSGDAPTVTDPGNHAIGQIIGIVGCPTSGDPWNITSNTTELASDTSVSIPGAATTVSDCLILAVFSTGTDIASTTHVTGWANPDLGSVTERMDNWTDAGTGGLGGGGFGLATGTKAVAGAYGPTTATVTTANFKALASIALKSSDSVAAAAGGMLLQRRPLRRS